MIKREFTSDGLIAESNGDHGIGQLYLAVEAKIKARFGTAWKQVFPAEPIYDMQAFTFNLKCVNEDIDAGRLAEPADFDGWVNAIVREFAANFTNSPLTEMKRLWEATI